jgi:hypothetical protein
MPKATVVSRTPSATIALIIGLCSLGAFGISKGADAEKVLLAIGAVLSGPVSSRIGGALALADPYGREEEEKTT